MSLRDRIAGIIVDFEGQCDDACVDRILADPEIAALREVAEKAKAYRALSVPLGSASYDLRAGVREDIELGAALARLEEARRG